MKKNDLKNGDIIMQRNGELGIYLSDKDVIIYQADGYDFVDLTFDDDLRDLYEGPEFDIMRVYRHNTAVSFSDYEEGDLVFERDEIWDRPTEEDREARRAAMEAARKAEEEEWARKRKENAAKYIRIISQAFYGNRTGTQVTRDEVDRFILGYQSSAIPTMEKIDRSIIRVPGSDNLVLVYNKYQEAKRRERQSRRAEETGIAPKPLARIPEENIELYSRCIACRMDAAGELQSLQSEDFAILDKYLAQ